MSAFLYTIALQWKLDIRSRSMLITCYVVPLLFFAIMGGIFTSVNPAAEKTLVQSMTIMGVSMGSMIGLPPTLNEVYASDIKKMYQANGVPLYLGLISIFLSAFIHLIIMSTIILFIAPIAFKASVPDNLPSYLAAYSLYCGFSQRGLRIRACFKMSSEIDDAVSNRVFALHYAVGHHVSCPNAAAVSGGDRNGFSCNLGI